MAVGAALTIHGHPEVLALGDMVSIHDAAGNQVPLPGLASVAMQQGRYAARSVHDRLHGTPSEPFRYVDKGSETWKPPPHPQIRITRRPSS